LHRPVVRHHGEHDIAEVRDLLQFIRRRAAQLLGKRLRRRAVDVIDGGDFVAAFFEPARHVGAHPPHSDESDLLSHYSFLSSSRRSNAWVITPISRPPLMPTQNSRKPYHALNAKIITFQNTTKRVLINEGEMHVLDCSWNRHALSSKPAASHCKTLLQKTGSGFWR